NVHAVPHAQRGNAIIEPWLTDQWYVNAGELATRAMAVVEEGKTQFVPKNWEKTYFDWMRNIQPWCISRQIWWGHQIPAWYGPSLQLHPAIGHPHVSERKIFVARSEQEARLKAEEYYQTEVRFFADQDAFQKEVDRVAASHPGKGSPY